MIRSRLWTLLVAVTLLGACGDDPRTRDFDDGGAAGADGSFADGGAMGDVRDGSMDATVGVDMDSSLARDAEVVQLPDGRIIGIGAGDAGTPFVFDDAGQVLCGNTPCQCSDSLDQDSDGLIDAADPECISPWDNDETSFATGISGDNRDEACQDCFFDGNSGSGNDGCRVATSCLRNPNDSSSGRGSCNTCEATAQCRTSCQAYTPNGCDCFGCCTVNLGSGITTSVALAPGCDIQGSTLSAACMVCVPSSSCRNECGRCELCPGKTIADLPADCSSVPAQDGGVFGDSDAGLGSGGDASVVGSSDGGPTQPTPSCDMGEQRCGAGLPSCPTLHTCAFGCCIQTPLF